MKNNIIKYIVSFVLISLILFTVGCNKTTNLNQVQNENGNEFNYLSISDWNNKGITKETTDKELIKSLWDDINNLKLSISKDTNVVDAGDYWLQFADTKDSANAKHTCVISPKNNKLIINDKVYDINKGVVSFEKYYDMLPLNPEQ